MRLSFPLCRSCLLQPPLIRGFVLKEGVACRVRVILPGFLKGGEGGAASSHSSQPLSFQHLPCETLSPRSRQFDSLNLLRSCFAFGRDCTPVINISPLSLSHPTPHPLSLGDSGARFVLECSRYASAVAVIVKGDSLTTPVGTRGDTPTLKCDTCCGFSPSVEASCKTKVKIESVTCTRVANVVSAKMHDCQLYC